MEKIYSYFKQETGLELSEKQLQQFERYFEMLVETNKVMNLTAITEREDVILKHFIDSIALGQCEYFKKNICLSDKTRIIDVGTGAGFPGIPLKIVYPCINLTLFDSLNKRIGFLNTVIETLGLTNCEAIHSRAEDGARNPKLREQYDIAVSRAVANMAVLSEYCIPFVKEGGFFIPYKTDKIEEELETGKKAIKLLGGKIADVASITLPSSDIKRSFVFINKTTKTPKQYPRKSGIVSKQPLL